MVDYLSFDKVLAVGGSWMVKPEFIVAEKYGEVTRLCREAVMASLGFELCHLGINEPDENTASQDAQKMEELFGFALKQGSSSHFAGAGFEFLKTRYLGQNGHIAISTVNLDRAVAYFESRGISTLPKTEKRNFDGALTAVYLDIEIGGFALQLMKKQN
jgi:2-dehydro-3-deoxyphosphogluconate aldolase/(4S)-4-hydroxy-2-oxoglutarate aldolase